MSKCTELSDRMPAVAHGTTRWSPADEAHLAECGDCGSEWGLVRRTAGLGAAIAPPDLVRIATGVLAALRTPKPSPSRRSRAIRWLLPVALAAGLVLVLVRTRTATRPEPAAVTLSLLPEADGLSESELETILRLLPTADPSLGGVDSLSEDELNQMVQDLEG